MKYKINEGIVLPNQRRGKILELPREDGSAKVIKVSKIFKVSEATIRQDLENIELEGFIKREHGGAFLKNIEAGGKSFTLIHQENMDKQS